MLYFDGTVDVSKIDTTQIYVIGNIPIGFKPKVFSNRVINDTGGNNYFVRLSDNGNISLQLMQTTGYNNVYFTNIVLYL